VVSARRLWSAIEPIHAVAYFHDEPTDALQRLGARGFWMSYFVGRFAPLGAVGPSPVAAMAFGFAPGRVARALPDAWSFVDPADAVVARVGACASVLRDLLPDEAGVTELAGRLEACVDGCDYGGRPLAAAWAAVEPGDDPYARLWVATSVLREHRGDGHVLAAVTEGLTGLEAGITHAGTGAVTRALLTASRGWTEDEWDAAVEALRRRGLVDADGSLTPAGSELRARVEARTDALAPSADESTVALAWPMRERVMGSGLLPVPNPIGLA